ncbi:inactive ribonuclease-like protein 10 [Sarcophilus harrisii]|uniref:Ribonuclease A family member 10 (inactive) n=1 Tax=Sarcophilus harrisii TaxID=9305 RepID=G3VKR6_SARHA|nr:inactive ribonuclease-like protein 10 [Sarcophilus harrisii]
MKSVLLQTFPVLLLLLLLLGLRLGLGLGLWLTSTKLGDNQELHNSFWDSDSWEEAEVTDDLGGTQITELQDTGKNDMFLNKMKTSLAEIHEKEVVDYETLVTEELFQKEIIVYSRQLKNSRYFNDMMAQKLPGSKSTCKEKHTFIHEHYKTVRAIYDTPSIPCKKRENNCHQSRELLQLTVCQLIHDMVFPHKCNNESIPVTMNIVISCNGLNPQTFKEHA